MTDEEPKPIDAMSDDELLRALTVDRDTFNGKMIAQLEAEFAGRGHDLSEKTRTASLRIGAGEERVASPEDILAALRGLESGSDVAVLTNAVGDRLGVYAGHGRWVTHYCVDGGYVGAACRADTDAMAADVRAHVALDRPTIERTHGMDGWESLVRSGSRAFVSRVADRLAAADVPFILQGPELVFVHPGFAHPSRGLELFVREGDARAAEAILDEEEGAIERLFADAEAHAERGDAAAELAVYEQLATLKPQDPMVHYNRGAILMDLERASDAVECFMEAVPLLLADEKLRGHVPDVRSNIESLLTRCEDPNPARHGLAQIDAFSGDLASAAALYQAILKDARDDSVAHLHLAQIYFESGERDDDASEHFKRFLELEPESPEAEHVKAQLRELGAP